MKRGDVVIATAPGFGTKPRPYIVIQSDDYAVLTTQILMPTTSDLAEPPSLLRVRIEPTKTNGLREISDVMTDIPITVRVGKIHKHVGQVSAADLLRVEQALALVLGFAG
jgi:mRNA interferase MazF